MFLDEKKAGEQYAAPAFERIAEMLTQKVS